MTAVAAEFETFKQSLIDQGREQALKKGREQGLALAILTVLAARKVKMNARFKTQVETCTDPALLERWLTRAATATAAAKVIADS